MINVEEFKQKILEVLKNKGPSLPILVSKEINLSSLFTSAILSEMISSKMIKVSSMKIGSSPLYLIQGQEIQLENFINHLNFREKEAFGILKKEQVLDDEKLDPVMRVAIRAIKDFAIPLKVNNEGKEKIFWKIHSLDKSLAVEKIKSYLYPEKTKEKKPEKKEKIKKPKQEKVKEEVKEEKKEEIKEKPKKEAKPIKEEKVFKPEKTETDFVKRIYDYLKNIKAIIIEETEKNKKSLLFKIEVKTEFGKVSMLLIAKDKKSVSEADIVLAGHKTQTEKASVLFLSTGDLNKKALLALEHFKNLVFFAKI